MPSSLSPQGDKPVPPDEKCPCGAHGAQTFAIHVAPGMVLMVPEPQLAHVLNETSSIK